MSNTYDRRAYINGVDFESIAGLTIDTIRPDSAPVRNIVSANLALNDGTKVIRTSYSTKSIILSGHIFTADRWDYEASRDALLGMLDSEREVEIVFEQSGGLRRYTGLYETIQFTYIERGLSTFQIQFRATQPFGVNVDDTIAIDSETITTNSYETNGYINGNVYAFPRVILTLTEWADAGTSKIITVESESEGKATSLAITYNFQEGATIVIDGNVPQVTVNGVTAAYVGRFPRGRKNIKFTISDNASDRSVNLQVRYNERNM